MCRPCALQRRKVTHQIRDFNARQQTAVRRLRRCLHHRELAQAALGERPQLVARVEQLHGQHVVIQQPSGDRGAASCVTSRTVRFCGRTVGAGIEQRFLELGTAPDPADIADVDPEPRSLAVDAVTRQAPAFALEQLLPVLRVAAR